MRATLRLGSVAVLCLLVLPARVQAFATDGRGWWALGDDAGQDGIHYIPVYINAENQAYTPLLQAAVDQWNGAFAAENLPWRLNLLAPLANHPCFLLTQPECAFPNGNTWCCTHGEGGYLEIVDWCIDPVGGRFGAFCDVPVPDDTTLAVPVDALAKTFYDTQLDSTGTYCCIIGADICVAYRLSDCRTIDWWTGLQPQPPGNKQFDMLSVLVHELGHYLGLDHDDVKGFVMKDSIDKGVTRRIPNADERAGLVYLYGPNRPRCRPGGVATVPATWSRIKTQYGDGAAGN